MHHRRDRAALVADQTHEVAEASAVQPFACL
jgi:hypothetical protein